MTTRAASQWQQATGVGAERGRLLTAAIGGWRDFTLRHSAAGTQSFFRTRLLVGLSVGRMRVSRHVHRCDSASGHALALLCR